MIVGLAAEDAPAAAALSAGFGWPHRSADWDWFLRLGRGVGWRDAGQLSGTAMWFPLGTHHASIGLVQVSPGLQGRGIGRRLMQAVMAAAAPRSLLLHATAEGAALYRSLGFVAGGVVEQWQGVVATQAAGPGITPAPLSESVIHSLDHAATGLGRANVLAACRESGVVLAGPGDPPSGYGVRRRFGRGQLIGPLIAANEADAAALLDSLAEPGFVRVDVPAGALTASLARLGLACVGKVQAMTTGTWPSPTGSAQRFALASQALG